MHFIARGKTDRGQLPCDDVAPGIQVLLRVADDDLLSGRAARGVQPGDLFHRDGEETEGVEIAEVLLGGEGEFSQIVNAFDVFGLDARRVHSVAVGGDVFVDPFDRRDEALALPRGDLIPRGGLGFGLPVALGVLHKVLLLF